MYLTLRKARNLEADLSTRVCTVCIIHPANINSAQILRRENVLNGLPGIERRENASEFQPPKLGKGIINTSFFHVQREIFSFFHHIFQQKRRFVFCLSPNLSVLPYGFRISPSYCNEIMLSKVVLIFSALLALHCAAAFTLPSASRSKSDLSMAPRFDKSSQKWFPTKPEEEMGCTCLLQHFYSFPC